MAILSPVVRHVRALGRQRYLLAEVAAVLDIPPSTLRRLLLADRERYGPSDYTWYKDQRVYLYTPEDVARLERHFEQLRRDQPMRVSGSPGRPRMWSHAERQDRQRRHAQAVYYRRRAGLLAETDPEGARRYELRHHALLAQLREEGTRRRRELATRM
jgi:hypothetical protein